MEPTFSFSFPSSIFFLSTGFDSDFGSSTLYVPVGEEAFPRYAKTSPLVNMPRTPVPSMFSGLATPFSEINRLTEGNKVFACFGCSAGRACGCGGVDEGAGVLVRGSSSTELGGLELSSLGGCRLEISSPSSASSAITFPTEMFFVPSGAFSSKKSEQGLPSQSDKMYMYQYFSHYTVILCFYINSRLVCFLLNNSVPRVFREEGCIDVQFQARRRLH
jgi:hypothetical protein